jgi:hypothetical protein
VSIARKVSFLGIYAILLVLTFLLWGEAANDEPFITFNARDAWVFVVGGTAVFLVWLESAIYWIIVGFMDRFRAKTVLMILLSALISYEMFYTPLMYINDISSRTGSASRLSSGTGP